MTSCSMTALTAFTADSTERFSAARLPLEVGSGFVERLKGPCRATAPPRLSSMGTSTQHSSKMVRSQLRNVLLDAGEVGWTW